MNEYWWTSPRRVIQPILTADEGNIDAEKMVEELYSLGCNTILQNVGGMFAWYPTKVPFHQTPPGMKGDVLGTVCQTAKKYGIRVLGRFDFSGLTERAFQARPEWFFFGADHKPMIDKGYYAACLSGSYLEEYVLPIIKEVTASYELDGAFFNMFGYRTSDRRGIFHGPCHCDACQKWYLENMNCLLPTELPPHHPDTIQYQNFTKKCFLDTLKSLDSLFKKVNQDFAMLIGSGYRSPSIILQEAGEVTEIELHWIPPNIKSISPEPLVPWRYMAGDTCRQVRTMKGTSSMINLYTCGGGRLTAHSKNTVSLGIAQTLANGGWPFIAFTGRPWRWDRKHEPAIKRFFSFMKNHDDCFMNNTSAARIALINSQMDLDSSGGQEHFLMEFRGFYRVLVKSHEEFDVLDVLQLSMANADKLLEKYHLVIMPNVKHLSSAAAIAIEHFVSGGGRLLMTAGSVSCGECGAALWRLKKILGIRELRMVRPWVENAFFEDARKLLPDTEVISVNGPVVYAEYINGTEKLLPMTGEVEYASPELECLAPANDQYGMVIHSFGPGKCVFFPWEIGRLVHIYGQEDHVSLIKTAVNLLMEKDRPFITDAPPQVEVTLNRQENGRLILQLVNETGYDGVEAGDPVILRDIKIGVKAPADAAINTLFGKYGLLPGSMDGDYLSFILPELELYELIVIE